MSSINLDEVNSYQNSDSSDSVSLNQSILNHLFLPYDLPSSADDDHLIKSNHQNETLLYNNIYVLLFAIAIAITLFISNRIKIYVQNEMHQD